MQLIADSGSTKTDWRFLREGQVVGQAKTVGFSPYYQNAKSIAKELEISILPKLEQPVTEVYYYGTGVTNGEKAEIIRQGMMLAFPTCQSVEAYSDVIGAARALCGHSAGIACILGTGSNSCFYDGEKIAFQIPPLGFWLGDEGSGGHLGKILVLSYLHKEMPEDLRAKFEKRFGVLDRLEIMENAYQKTFPNRYFASFSKFLFDNRSNPFAYQLIYSSFSLFFEKYICKYPQAFDSQVHFVGSVAFYYSDILRQVANDKKIAVRNILEAPIAGLALYHQNILM